MEWIIWLAVIFMVGTTIVNVRTKSQITRAIESKPELLDKMIEEPKAKHRLARTWIVPTPEGRIPAGWRWKCSCTVWGVAEDASIGYGELGTEDKAIEGFKSHAKKYLEVNTDFYKNKYERSEAEFAEYRRLCYCKDANDALAPWKDT
jgi:hypothetical protein